MSELIPLTKGKFAIVDAADFEWLSQWRWLAMEKRHTFYAARFEKSEAILMHRLLNGMPDGYVTDHIDGNGLNNQRANLRTCTQLQNMMNRHGKNGGTSRFKGVWADPNPRNRKLWRAAIRINGKLKYLGRFHTQEDAAIAYDAAANLYFGEFSRTTPADERPRC